MDSGHALVVDLYILNSKTIVICHIMHRIWWVKKLAQRLREWAADRPFSRKVVHIRRRRHIHTRAYKPIKSNNTVYFYNENKTEQYQMLISTLVIGKSSYWVWGVKKLAERIREWATARSGALYHLLCDRYIVQHLRQNFHSMCKVTIGPMTLSKFMIPKADKRFRKPISLHQVSLARAQCPTPARSFQKKAEAESD